MFWGTFEPLNIPLSSMASVAVSVFPDSWGQLAGIKGGRVPSFSLALRPFQADYMELAVP